MERDYKRGWNEVDQQPHDVRAAHKGATYSM